MAWSRKSLLLKQEDLSSTPRSDENLAVVMYPCDISARDMEMGKCWGLTGKPA